MIEPGIPAPDFTLRDQDGKEVSLQDLRGQTTVLVFYPSDFSPTCTDQLSVYQEALPRLAERGARLYGVSVDSAFCHKAFQQHLAIDIPLLADFHPKGEVAKRFGVWAEDYGVAKRALVMIGPDLLVRWAYKSNPLEVPPADLIFGALEQQATAGRLVTAAEIFRAMSDAFNSGDYEACFDFIDPGVEWEDPHGIPGGGLNLGHDGVRAWFRRWLGAWEDFSTEIDEVIDRGERAVVVEHMRGRGRASGIPVDEVWTAIYEARDGRITRRTSHPDKHAALAALDAVD